MAATREANRRGEGDQLRAQLVEAATELLLAPQSVAAPSLRAVARACGVSPSAVYLHFDSQHDLVAAVIVAQYADLQAALGAADRPTAAPVQRLKAAAQAYAAWGVAHPGAYQLLFESADTLPEGVAETATGAALIDDVATLLRAHGVRRADESRRLALRIWACLHGLVSLRIHKPGAEWTSTIEAEAAALVASLVA